MSCNCKRRKRNASRKRGSINNRKPVTIAQRRSELRKVVAGQPGPTPDGYVINSYYAVITPARYQEELDTWLESPFRHMGRNKNGTDCIGLVMGVYKNLGLIQKELETEEYSRQWYLTDNIEKHPVFEKLKETITLEKIDNPDDLLVGDILCFAYGKGIESHVGLLSNRQTIIHSVAGEQANKVIESRFDDNRWRKRFVYGYRIKSGEK